MQRFGAKGNGTSVYFRDPDGSLMEFISYGADGHAATIDQILLTSGVLLWPAAASAEVVWTLTKKDGRSYLEGFSSETEADSEFWAHCQADGSIQIGVGADSHVGKGKGEAVRLTLVSGGVAAKLAGVSKESINVEMTSGMELRAKIARTDPVFAVFATGKPIAVSGSLERRATWKVKGLKAKAEAFLKACGPKVR